MHAVALRSQLAQHSWCTPLQGASRRLRGCWARQGHRGEPHACARPKQSALTTARAQARLDALEDGGAEDAMAGGSDDDEFDCDEEEDDEPGAQG